MIEVSRLLEVGAAEVIAASAVASGSASLPTTPSVHDWFGTLALSKLSRKKPEGHCCLSRKSRAAPASVDLASDSARTA